MLGLHGKKFFFTSSVTFFLCFLLIKKIFLKRKYRDIFLIYASRYGHTNIVNLLIQYGANVNTVDKNNKTAYIYAAEKNHIDIVRILVERTTHNRPINKKTLIKGYFESLKNEIASGAGVNEVDEDGNTALIIASQYGHTNIVNLLIQYGANVNKVGKDGNTALMTASRYGNIEIVNRLLEENVNVDAVDKNGKTAYIYAAEKNHIDIVRILVERTTHNRQISENTLIKGCFKPLKNEIASGADVNANIKGGATPLFLAINCLNKNNYSRNEKERIRKCIKILIKYGADVNKVSGGFTSSSGYTPLTYASSIGCVETVNLLIQYGADINAEDDNGFTALSWARRNRNNSIIKSLETGNIHQAIRDEKVDCVLRTYPKSTNK